MASDASVRDAEVGRGLTPQAAGRQGPGSNACGWSWAELGVLFSAVGMLVGGEVGAAWGPGAVAADAAGAG